MIRTQFYSARAQRGLTIVEFLIAGVLGLILLAGIGQLFLGSNQTFRMQRQLADIQDTGRFASWFLKQDFEQAGWNQDATGNALPLDNAVIVAADANTPAGFCPGDICSVNGADDVSDSVTVQYMGIVDCAGSQVNGGAEGIVQNRYFVDANEGQLMCHGSGTAAAQPLINNVDSFQVLYGVDLKTPPAGDTRFVCADRAVDRYVPIDAVPADGVIVAIRFSLLVGSDENSSVPKESRTYQVSDRSLQFDDRSIRRVFNLTVPIRNPVMLSERCPKPV